MGVSAILLPDSDSEMVEFLCEIFFGNLEINHDQTTHTTGDKARKGEGESGGARRFA